MRIVGITIKIKVIDQSRGHAAQRLENAIYAFWHNRMLLCFFFYRRFHLGKKMCVLADDSYAGEFVGRLMKDENVNFISHSIKDSAKKEYRDLIRDVKSGRNAWITPDGPRGPIYKVKSGVIRLAQKTGRPIIPVGFSANRMKMLGSWDRFILPFPFSQEIVILSEPIYVPSSATKDAREKMTTDLEVSINKVTQYADEYLTNQRL
ncbi:MAG: lysophospholipid acyltransferase family protein [Candidatus Omnitrophota bacterium]